MKWQFIDNFISKNAILITAFIILYVSLQMRKVCLTLTNSLCFKCIKISMVTSRNYRRALVGAFSVCSGELVRMLRLATCCDGTVHDVPQEIHKQMGLAIPHRGEWPE